MDFIHERESTYDSLRGPSPRLWKDFPMFELLTPMGANKGYGIWEDFVNHGGLTGAPYLLLAGGTGTAAIVDGLGGVLQLFSTADNDEGVCIGGNNVGAPFLISTSAPKELIFEARFKVDSVAASMADVFVGLGEAGMGTTDLLFTDADAMADNDFLGFHRIAAETTGLTLGWRRSGQAAQTSTGVGTLAADTWIKAGFRFDPIALTVTPWVNGVEVPAKKITATQAAAATFPNDYLTVLAGIKGIDAADHTLKLDWLACYQLS